MKISAARLRSRARAVNRPVKQTYLYSAQAHLLILCTSLITFFSASESVATKAVILQPSKGKSYIIPDSVTLDTRVNLQPSKGKMRDS